jgi:hypothetical protein
MTVFIEQLRWVSGDQGQRQQQQKRQQQRQQQIPSLRYGMTTRKAKASKGNGEGYGIDFGREFS